MPYRGQSCRNIANCSIRGIRHPAYMAHTHARLRIKSTLEDEDAFDEERRKLQQEAEASSGACWPWRKNAYSLRKRLKLIKMTWRKKLQRSAEAKLGVTATHAPTVTTEVVVQKGSFAFDPAMEGVSRRLSPCASPCSHAAGSRHNAHLPPCGAALGCLDLHLATVCSPSSPLLLPWASGWIARL